MLRGFSWKQGICYFSTVVPRHHTSALSLQRERLQAVERDMVRDLNREKTLGGD
ncbi:hypothetical protein MOQ80_26590 [Klebsiella pneumoniae]|nr:hypothetical protein MOQ80_26590 [Klebsiella pneumoniae]